MAGRGAGRAPRLISSASPKSQVLRLPDCYRAHMSTNTQWAYRLSAPHVFERIIEQAPASVRPGEILVKLTAGAVCGSDLPFARGAMVTALGKGAPGQPMHEVVGTVLTSAHDDFGQGDKVVGWATNWDALRETFITRAEHVAKVRLDMPDTHASVAQSVACLMTVFERLGPLDGRSVGIVGLGSFGLLAAELARDHGAGKITGIDPLDRTEDAAELPFDELVCDTSRGWARDITDADRPDIVLEMVGHQTSTVADAMAGVASNGTVVAFGVPDDDWYALPLRDFFRRNGTLITGVTRHHRDMLERAQDYLNEQPWLADYIITDIYPIDEVEDAFATAMVPTPGQRKIVLEVD